MEEVGPPGGYKLKTGGTCGWLSSVKAGVLVASWPYRMSEPGKSGQSKP